MVQYLQLQTACHPLLEKKDKADFFFGNLCKQTIFFLEADDIFNEISFREKSYQFNTDVYLSRNLNSPGTIKCAELEHLKVKVEKRGREKKIEFLLLRDFRRSRIFSKFNFSWLTLFMMESCRT